MKLILASAGAYPRIGDTKEQQRLRRAHAQREREEISPRQFSALQDEVTREVIAEQIAAGVELVTDGLIRWHDPLSHIASHFSGFKIGGLLRFFDTNYLFRQPIVSGRIRGGKPFLVKEFQFARAVSSRPVKPVLTGPYTLAKLSDNSAGKYKSLDARVHDCAAALAAEVEALARAGAEIIQVDEPAMLKWPQECALAASGLKTLAAARGKSRLALYTYFGAASPLYDQLQELPVDILGLDFTYDAKLADVIARRGSEKPLALGLIDGRNTKLETAENLRPTLEKLARGLNGARGYLNPSCGLEYLPRDCARRKLENMAALKKELNV